MSDLVFKEAAPFDEWVAAATADGWTKEPTYPGHEDENRAFGLRKDGYHVMGFRREVGHPQQPAWFTKSEYKLTAWDPKGQVIQLPATYDFAAIEAARLVCGGCGKAVPEVYHVGFAGKACADCLPAMRRQLEYPGWTN